MTGLDLIKGAFEIIGVYTPGNDLEPQESTTGLKFLKAMLGTWSNQISAIYEETQESFSLVSGQIQYTLGPSGVFVTTKPVNLLYASVRDANGIDHELDLMPNNEYQEILQKNPGSALPWALGYNFTHPNITLTLYPPPGENYTLRLTSRKPFSTVTLSGEYSLPQGGDDAIMWNLAVRLAAVFGRRDIIGDPRSPSSIAGIAAATYRGLCLAALEPERLRLDPMHPGNSNVLRSWKYD